MAKLTASGITFDTNNYINSKYWMYPQLTKKLFYQASAPTGWTQDTANTSNKALRVVNGTGGVNGGVNSFTTIFASSPIPISVPFNTDAAIDVNATGNTTLSTGQIPEHTHNSLSTIVGGSFANPFSNSGDRLLSGTNSTSGFLENGGVGGQSHFHPFSGTASIITTGNTSVNISVQYIDAIVCSFN